MIFIKIVCIHVNKFITILINCIGPIDRNSQQNTKS